MKVKNIKFINNRVEIILDEKSFSISKENYIENPVAIESYIDEEKISFLQKQEKIIDSKIEIIRLLNKKSLTEKEICVKLKEKGLEKEDKILIIESLKRTGLINDEYCASLLIDSMLFKRKGKLEMIKCLKEKGIDENIINKLIDDIEEETYLNNFNKVCEKYMKMYSSKSNKIKEQLVVNKLKEQGYEYELISSISFDKDNDQELELAKQNLIKIIKNKKIDLNNYENLNKIKLKLHMKGFNYDIINLALEEVINDEIN